MRKRVYFGVKVKGTPIHNSYAGMRQRCEYEGHTTYSNYGGRGISCLWENFEEFYIDMLPSWFPGSTLERINVNGNYCKDNCIWLESKLQARNTRKNIHTLETVSFIRSSYKNGLHSQVALAKMFGDSQGNISNIVLNRTWFDENYTPPEKRRGKKL